VQQTAFICLKSDDFLHGKTSLDDMIETSKKQNVPSWSDYSEGLKINSLTLTGTQIKNQQKKKNP
jgi:hypothetical protein